MKIINLYGTFHPKKKKHVKDMKSLYDKYPCNVCKNLNQHRDLVTGRYRPCKFRKNACRTMGKCQYFDRVGETRAEAEQWRKIESWK